MVLKTKNKHRGIKAIFPGIGPGILVQLQQANKRYYDGLTKDKYLAGLDAFLDELKSK